MEMSEYLNQSLFNILKNKNVKFFFEIKYALSHDLYLTTKLETTIW